MTLLEFLLLLTVIPILKVLRCGTVVMRILQTDATEAGIVGSPTGDNPANNSARVAFLITGAAGDYQRPGEVNLWVWASLNTSGTNKLSITKSGDWFWYEVRAMHNGHPNDPYYNSNHSYPRGNEYSGQPTDRRLSTSSL